jgi:hypothetical protein
MVYMIIASIICAAQAAQQGGAANSTMLLSVVVTYGCEYPFPLCDRLISRLQRSVPIC